LGSFYQLVLAYNNATFGQEFFSEMDGTRISLPSHEEVLEQVARNEAENAEGAGGGNKD
jgi:hypothetical protein